MGQAGSAVMKGWVLGTLRTAGLVLSKRDVSALLGWGRGGGCRSGRPKPSSSPPLLSSCQGGARPQDVCRLYSAWALTQVPLIHSRMGRAAGTAGGGKGPAALSLSWSTPLSKFRGGVGAWLGAQASLYPTSTSDGQRRASPTFQPGVTAITNKGFSKEETAEDPHGELGTRRMKEELSG